MYVSNAGRNGWWRRQPIERKLPVAFVALLTLGACFYTYALYREVERSAAESVVERLERVADQISDLLATTHAARVAALRATVESTGSDAVMRSLAADSVPVVLMDASLRIVERSGPSVSPDAHRRLQSDGAEILASPTRAGVGRLFNSGDSIYYWIMAEVGDAGQVLAIRRPMRYDSAGSRALETLIGETTVIIANTDDYGAPWVQLEGPPLEPAERPAPADSGTYSRAGTVYMTHLAPVPGAPWTVIAETPAAVTTERAKAFAAGTLPFTVVFIVIGAVLAWLIGHHITLPLSDLAGAANAIGSGEYHRRVTVREGGDLGMMADAFNRMAEEVERSSAEMDARVKRRTEELELVNHELQAFSYSVSHDLRSPLRSIDGFSQALLEDYAPQLDATAQDYLHRLRAGAQRMGQLIDDLLMLSRVSRQPLDRHAVNVHSLALDVVAELRSGSPDRDVTVDIEDDIEVNADRGLLHVVLQNLIGNAWKFTARVDRPRIELGRKRNGDGDVMYVRDNGAGFDMAYAEQLFAPFQRLHSSREFSGTGIGLATVQRIVSRHGGRVWAESKPGEGATFYFTVARSEHGE